MSDLMLLLSEGEFWSCFIRSDGVWCTLYRNKGWRYSEVIQHGDTGYLCEVGDTTGVADQAIQLLKDEELHRNMGESEQVECLLKSFALKKSSHNMETI